MTPEYNFLGLNFPELVLFGILIYLAAIILIVIFVRWTHHRMFCPFSGDCIHSTYINCRCACPTCSMKQSKDSVFCCRRNHSVYDLDGFPKCKLNCFKPDCKFLRCCCCEFFIEKEQDVSPPKTVVDVNVTI